MDTVALELKRAFHSSIKVGLMMTRKFGLTPSRFQLMFAIKCERQAWYSQRTLRDLLGVAASTLSRMIDALVKRGFLRRRRKPGDRRRNELRLTLFGKRALGCAYRSFVKSGFADYVFGRALTDSFDGDIVSDEERAAALGSAANVLRILRLNLGNDARFDYDDTGCQPRPVGRIVHDPEVRWVWESAAEQLPIIELMAAIAA
jgi:DNA-binding MarR family transcriptional regulator